MQIVLREVVALGGAIAADLRLKREVIEGADDLAFELLRPGHALVGRSVSQLPLTAEKLLLPWRIHPYSVQQSDTVPD